MKADELMIGDWVMRKDTKNPYEIKAIRGEKYCINNDNSIATDKAEDWSSMSYYEPIPLTPEILEKNGWKEYPQVYSNQKALNFDVYKFEDKLGIIIQGNCIVLNYVHELQHALKSAKLTDLAENFKV